MTEKRRVLATDPVGEAEFLAAYDVAEFGRVSIAVDLVLLSVVDERLALLLVRRTAHPARGMLALPGGFPRGDESLDAAAARVLHDKAALDDAYLEQLYTFGDVDRDPRARVISVAYYALVDAARFSHAVAAGSATIGYFVEDAAGEIAVAAADGAPLALAFDHATIAATALRRIRGKLDYAPVGYELLAERFSLGELQRVHEIVGGRRLNKDAFRRKLLATGALEATDAMQANVGHRPGVLYRRAAADRAAPGDGDASP